MSIRAHFAGRISAILVMGFLLLLLSALIRSAAAQDIGDTLPGVGVIGLAVGVTATVVGGLARTMRAAWGRLCLLDGLASLVLLLMCLLAKASPGASADATAQAIGDFGVARPIGAAFGAALLSGVLGIVAVCLGVALLAASHFLLRPPRRAHPSG